MVVDRFQLQGLMHEQIPLSLAMAVSVDSADWQGVALSAPLAPNQNHLHSAFGGSLSTLATLAAWSALRVRMEDLDKASSVVIQHNSMRYLRPATDDFQAFSEPIGEPEWARFVEVWQAKRIARIDIRSRVVCNGELVGQFEGRFVALSES